MVRIRVNLKDDDMWGEDFFGFFPDKVDVKRYLWDAYSGGVNYTGKEEFILSPEGDIIQIEIID
jgi:hypothetical protein